jgi:hypothetical protein
VGGTELGQRALLTLNGGNLSAHAIDLEAGAGAIEASVNDVTGAVNVSGGSAHFASDADVLDLGNLDLAGDPTFFNTGDISINDNISVGQNLAILATGNVTASKAVVIQTRDLLAGGHNVTIVAGATLQPFGSPTAKGTIPPQTPLLPGQTIQVMGGSLSGGTISLDNSTIDTRSTSGNQPGGSVTLVAFGGTGTGGITGVNIASGGSGTGANGGVTLIAGGTVGSTSTAIAGITINATGGTGLPPAAINLFAAQPVGSVRFDNNGVATGTFSPGDLTAGAILPGPASVPGSGIITDGGTVTIKTNGMFSNQAAVTTSGAGAGSDAGDITIIAGSINLNAPLLAVGGNGAGGTDQALAGLPGGDGQSGGKGGMITLKGSSGITINANIQADGGNGGNGGDGASGRNGAILDGGAGGLGGNGGMAGMISLTTTDTAITQASDFTMSANGGSGGIGGAGGNGGSLLSRRLLRGHRRSARLLRKLDRGGIGGAGGNGGLATAGGSLRVDAGAGNINLGGTLNFDGGAGGNGGGGGNGGTTSLPDGAGGIGGATGIAQNGAMGGMVGLNTTSGNITLAAITANGGRGGSQLATSGSGGHGAHGGNGGAVSNCGAGAQGGQILVISTAGTILFTDGIQLDGGAKGIQASSEAAGAGGRATISRGGNGGAIGNGGDGGFGGLLSVSTSDDINTSSIIDADGGAGGVITSTAGAGGAGPHGGFGGDVGNAGGGGQGGSVSLTSMSGDVVISNPISAVGGAGGSNSATGGEGGIATAEAGGRGGSIGNGIGGGGAGGKGGDLSISSWIQHPIDPRSWSAVAAVWEAGTPMRVMAGPPAAVRAQAQGALSVWMGRLASPCRFTRPTADHILGFSMPLAAREAMIRPSPAPLATAAT